jgi:protein-L-isoaspartate(D-aspartate) O-methyltransferase
MDKFDFSAARETMVESQIRTADVTEPALLGAFRRTARERFIPQNQMALAYADAEVRYETGRILLRPRDFAKLVQAADIKPTDVVLDLACARGYSTAVLAQISDTVVGLETSVDDVNRATDLLMEAGILNAAVVQGDLKRGASEHGPFNVILLAGAVDSVPEAWFSQLADGGRLAVIVRKGRVGRATIYTKSGQAVGDRVEFDANAPFVEGFAPEASFVF